VIITLDCVRPDFLGCYGCESVRTPTLDRLARGGVVFEQAITQAPNTWVSHAGIFTGLYPPRHGLRSPYDRLSPEIDTLASLLARQGYATAGFPGSDLAGSRMGFHEGFDFFYEGFLNTGGCFEGTDGGPGLLHGTGRADALLAAGGVHDQSPGVFASGQAGGGLFPDRANPVRIQGRNDWDDVLEAARGWLARQRDPVFLWFHYLDTHHLPALDLPDYYRFSREPLWQFYEGKVSYADDRCVRAVIDLLRNRGGFEETLFVVLSDHGEGLLPGRPPSHNGELTEEVLRVPLIFFCERAPWNGVRVPHLVRTTDLLPTLLGILCGPGSCPQGARGPTFSGIPLPSLNHEFPAGILQGPASDFAYAENVPLGHYCVRTSEWKFILRPEGEALVHLDTDPGEQLNVVHRHPRTARYLKEALEEVRSSRSLAPELPADREEEETRRLLRSFGYLA